MEKEENAPKDLHKREIVSRERSIRKRLECADRVVRARFKTSQDDQNVFRAPAAQPRHVVPPPASVLVTIEYFNLLTENASVVHNLNLLTKASIECRRKTESNHVNQWCLITASRDKVEIRRTGNVAKLITLGSVLNNVQKAVSSIREQASATALTYQ